MVSRAVPRVLNRRMAGIPEGAVYVGRPSPFGNPYRMQRESERVAVIEEYRRWLNLPKQAWLLDQIREQLRGKDLVCWCAPKPCHADVLLEIADGE